MIPAFNIDGVVPPIRPGENGSSLDRAPYPTDILTFCTRFGGTPERRAILGGLLDLREALRGVGIVEGFQWLDGSFAEDVERLRRRPPADIDVVTFGVVGDRATQVDRARQAPALFNHTAVKARYKVDHYLVQTDDAADVDRSQLSRKVAYWYSMWAHQRDTQRWKGFVSVSLGVTDADARLWLAQHSPSGAGAP